MAATLKGQTGGDNLKGERRDILEREAKRKKIMNKQYGRIGMGTLVGRNAQKLLKLKDIRYNLLVPKQATLL